MFDQVGGGPSTAAGAITGTIYESVRYWDRTTDLIKTREVPIGKITFHIDLKARKVSGNFDLKRDYDGGILTAKGTFSRVIDKPEEINSFPGNIKNVKGKCQQDWQPKPDTSGEPWSETAEAEFSALRIVEGGKKYSGLITLKGKHTAWLRWQEGPPAGTK